MTLCFAGVAIAQEDPSLTLQGVSRAQIEANGLPATVTLSARGVNQLGAQQIPRSGYDLINDGIKGTVLLPGLRQVPGGPCTGLSDNAFFLIHIAGRPGDADGDGDFNGNGGACAARRNNLPPIPANPKIFDGSSTDLSVLSSGENMRVTLDRNCDGKLDLIFALTVSGNQGSSLVVEVDDFTGLAGTNLGGQGVAWEAAVFPGDAYTTVPCPDPAGINGYYILRVPQFSQYFYAPHANNPGGLSPTNFGYNVAAGSVDDGLEEDLFAGNVDVPQPALSITKGPDLALCPAEEGNWTISVRNDGNTLLSDLVVTDVLPAGVTLVSVVSPPGIVASGTTGSITFTAFDLAQCETKDIVIRVRANDDCSGNGVNSASVAGNFETRCSAKTPGTLVLVPISAGPATANFTCKVKPCVSIVLNSIPPQCPNTAVTVTGTATNCSNGPARLFVRIGDGQEVDLGIVQQGGQVPISLPAGNLSCPAGGSFTVNARADAEGDPDCPGTTDSETVTVQCKPVPCVSISLNAIPPQCPDTPITVTGTATNCGTTAARLFVRLGDGAEVDLGLVAGNGGTAAISLPAGNLSCPAGGTFTVNARADVDGTEDCHGTGDSESVTVACKSVPCVSLQVNPLPPQCPNTPVTVTGTATNCGTSVANLFVRLGDGPETNLGPVNPNGGTAPFSLPAGNLVCVNSHLQYTVNARADVEGTEDCPGTGDSENVSIQCLTPDIEVTKTGPARVNNGATISYTITVQNASTTTDLVDIVVKDFLCAYVSNPRNFGGNCTAGAPTISGDGRTITWPDFDLARNTSCTITFDVTADIIGGGGTCPSTVQCPNRVEVEGFCPGSGGQSSDEDETEWTTEILCVGENCPRTVGFWGAQCAQRGNGSTKFTQSQVSSIAQCISSRSAFFDWSAGEAFDQFCRTINPPKPMTQRRQAKRQFAGLLANYCTDFLNLQPSQGGKIFLDPSTPISCDGFTADTIGELIDEIDALLISLEGQDLNDPAVKAAYGRIISCTDAINNGRNIPTSPDCEHGTTTPTGEETSEVPETETDAVVELYRPTPNPFSGSTSFAYSVNGSDDAAVDITVFDVAGRQIRKLVAGTEKAGVHIVTWDGRNDGGTRVNRGVYFVRTVIAGRKEATNRILYLTEAR